jgi:hypothetical protein
MRGSFLEEGKGREGKGRTCRGLVRKMRIVRARFYKNGVKGPTTGLHVAVATAFGVDQICPRDRSSEQNEKR